MGRAVWTTGVGVVLTNGRSPTHAVDRWLRAYWVMDVTTEVLFGHGTLYEFVTEAGVGVGIHATRDGCFELYTREPDDPDAARLWLRLTAGEARTIAMILAARERPG
ncbi:hypothetical protein SAMN04489718_1239 [Actinopolyspora saharensis]|uniref:Potassium/proton antiporter subunit KhtT-like N-terminal domain-containing protein n=2 Tax=Actinopolyspora saharensis TaxID=995062 RepID=A0A1H0ZV25_9ACTN|nr:hypothetical protein SAMN04489718_1239 [Actinopolyspora saharensis]